MSAKKRFLTPLQIKRRINRSAAPLIRANKVMEEAIAAHNSNLDKIQAYCRHPAYVQVEPGRMFKGCFKCRDCGKWKEKP